MGNDESSSRSRQALTYVYAISAASIFLFSAIGKLTSDFTLPMMKLRDPFLPFLTNRELLLSVGLVEGIVVAVLSVAIWRNNPLQASRLSIWLSTLFIFYRIGLFFAPEPKASCKCFGVGSLFFLKDTTSELLGALCLIYLQSLGWIVLARATPIRFKVFSRRSGFATGVVITFVALSPAGQTANYDADGAHEYRGKLFKFLVLANRQERLISEADFTWYLDSSGQWFLENRQRTYLTEKPDAAIRLTGYNGHDSFSVTYPGGTTDSSRSAGNHPAEVVPGDSHMDGDMWGYLFWFAFVGGQSFQDSPQAHVAPIQGGFPGYVQAYVHDLVFQRSSQDRTLIAEANWAVISDYLSYDDLLQLPNALIPDSSENAGAAKDYIRKLQGELKWRKIDSRYRVEEFGRIGQKVYPKKFIIEEFTWDSGLPTNALLSRISCIITNVAEVAPKTSVLPELFGTISVTDLRFRIKTKGAFRNRIRYMISDRQWIVDTNNTRLREILVTHKLKPIPRASSAHYARYRVTMALFLIILLTPPIWWLLRRARSQKSDST